MEMKEWITGKRHPWPWHRTTGKCPVHRFEATGQLIHPAVGSNQVGCSCSLQSYLSLETTKKIPVLNQSWRADFELAIRRPPSPISCPDDHQLLVTIVAKCCPLTMSLECAVLQESRKEYYAGDSFNNLFETIPETCIVEILQEAGLFYLIWTVRHSIWFSIWTTLTDAVLESKNVKLEPNLNELRQIILLVITRGSHSGHPPLGRKWLFYHNVT